MKKYSIEIKWAILYAMMTLIWMFLEMLFGLHDKHIDKQDIAKTLIFIPIIAIYVFALRDKRNNYYSGVITYKQGFITGLIITLIIVFLSPLTQIITSNIITPEFFHNAIKCVVNEGLMSQEEAEKYFSLRNYIIQGIIGSAIIGLLTSAIVAIFIRTRKK